MSTYRCRQFVILDIIHMIFDSAPELVFGFDNAECSIFAKHDVHNTFRKAVHMMFNLIRATIKEIE